jgi:ABC-type bacteriocin/lantibiotic exporter with double-glycine peptidase domain
MKHKQAISSKEHPVSQEKLIQYLEGSLPDLERQHIEKQLEEDEFLNDAMEGLHQITDSQQINQVVNDLNRSIQKQVTAQQRKKNKQPIFSLYWVYIAIILLIILILSAYLILSQTISIK